MRIHLDRLVLDGVGPFQGREELDLAGDGISFCYAPNGHGKTTTIDLVRWLFEGKTALGSFRSLHQDEERKIINSKRFAEASGGEVQALLDVEGQGRYRITRSIPFGTSPTSTLTVEADTGEGWAPIDEPEAFLSKLMPRERLGFNLLTGEHIQEFVEDLKGPVVKESLQRLLQRPELVSARNSLDRIHEEISEEADDQSREANRLRNYRTKLEDLRERKNNLEDHIDETTETAETLDREIDELNRQLSEADTVEESREEKATLEGNVEQRRARRDRQRARLAKTLTPAWRNLLKAAAEDTLTDLLERHDAAQDALETYSRNQAVIGYLETLLDEARCTCGDALDEETEAAIEAKIDALGQAEPTVPDLPADDRTLHNWVQDPGLDDVLSSLEDHGALIEETTEQIEAELARIDELEEILENAHIPEARRLRAKMRAKRNKRSEARNERQTYLRRHDDVRERIDDVQQRIKETSVRDVDDRLMRAARTYGAAFEDAIQRALPSLHERLRRQVQQIFGHLFAKDEEGYEVKLSETSMVPRIVRRNADGEPEAIRLSEGEKTRLGLALLFALRRVAAERPFLLLDAPFSTLDDDGTHRLLELIGSHEGQVVVFTKRAFPSGRWFDAIRKADPRVFRMDWNPADTGGHQGYTEISETDVEDLRVAEAAP